MEVTPRLTPASVAGSEEHSLDSEGSEDVHADSPRIPSRQARPGQASPEVSRCPGPSQP
jgi:hypothetical protein